MKTGLFALIIAVGLLTVLPIESAAGTKKNINEKQLPAAAQEFLTQHFEGQQVSYILVDKEFMHTTYELMFANGSQIEFAKNGEWKEVDTKNKAVPTAIVPASLKSYVRQNFDSAIEIVQIKRQGRGYELELSNKLELTFNSKGELTSFDN